MLLNFYIFFCQNIMALALKTTINYASETRFYPQLTNTNIATDSSCNPFFLFYFTLKSIMKITVKITFGNCPWIHPIDGRVSSHRIKPLARSWRKINKRRNGKVAQIKICCLKVVVAWLNSNMNIFMKSILDFLTFNLKLILITNHKTEGKW